MLHGLEQVPFFHSVGTSHPKWRSHIFQKGRAQPPTSLGNIPWNPMKSPLNHNFPMVFHWFSHENTFFGVFNLPPLEWLLQVRGPTGSNVRQLRCPDTGTMGWAAGRPEESGHGSRWIITTSLRPHHRWWIVRGIISKWPWFRLVKYYNLPR